MHLWCSLGEWVGRCKHPKYRSSTRPSCLIVLVATAAATTTTTTATATATTTAAATTTTTTSSYPDKLV